MTKPSLAVYCFGYQLEKIAYPWRASLASALELADSVHVAACDSETMMAIENFQARHRDGEKLFIWPHPWGDHHSIQAHIANFLLDKIGTHADYALKLDMDEVLAEWSFDRFWEVLEASDATIRRSRIPVLGKPHYTHFCPDDKTTFPFIYDSKAVLSFTRHKLRYNTDPSDNKNADACALGGGSEISLPLEVFHYGKMHTGRRAEAKYKETEFTKLYVDRGFPDPKVVAQASPQEFDYLKVFDLALGEGKFRPYDGPHPKFVQSWLEEMRQREQENQAIRAA